MFKVNVQKTAMVGFWLDVAVILFLFWGINYADFSQLPEDLRDILAAMSVSPLFYLFHTGIIVGHAAGLLLISQRHRAGLVVAMIAGCMLLPLSIVYLIGCTVSHYTNRFYHLYRPGLDRGRALRAFKGYMNKTYLACAIGGTLAAMLLFPHFLLSSTLLNPVLCFIAAFSYLSYRSASNLALVIYDQGIALFPHVLALRSYIPFESIKAATLMEDDSIRFDVDTANGGASFKWALSSVNPRQQGQALEELGRALHNSGVPLY